MKRSLPLETKKQNDRIHAFASVSILKSIWLASCTAWNGADSPWKDTNQRIVGARSLFCTCKTIYNMSDIVATECTLFLTPLITATSQRLKKLMNHMDLLKSYDNSFFTTMCREVIHKKLNMTHFLMEIYSRVFECVRFMRIYFHTAEE